jgi:hypothetical protein
MVRGDHDDRRGAEPTGEVQDDWPGFVGAGRGRCHRGEYGSQIGRVGDDRVGRIGADPDGVEPRVQRVERPQVAGGAWPNEGSRTA